MQQQLIGAVGLHLVEHWFRQPGARVRLAAHPGGVQMIDGLTRDNCREESSRRCDLHSAATLPLQVCLLDDIFGVHHAAKHAVRDRKEQRTQVLKDFDVTHWRLTPACPEPWTESKRRTIARHHDWSRA